MPRWMTLFAFVLFALMLTIHTCPVSAQEAATKKKVTSDADLPRISYPMAGSASDLLTADDATFDAFARKVAADVDSILANYQIDDKPTLRGYFLAKFNAQILAGDPRGALATIDKVRDLEEKPEARITDGILSRPLLNAWIETGSSSGPAFANAFLADFQKEINAFPWAPVQDSVKELKASFQMLSPTLFAGSYKANVDPQVAKTGSIDYSAAVSLLSSRVVIKYQLPLREQIESVLVPYIQAHAQKKPDI